MNQLTAPMGFELFHNRSVFRPPLWLLGQLYQPRGGLLSFGCQRSLLLNSIVVLRNKTSVVCHINHMTFVTIAPRSPAPLKG